eukprot:CAMPEP_0181212526 /NCGR_PEP_ID=MMETSP1096-20121128/24398_1 /TAXON_ID=156174 ORGANISM="Chrysochromulina ericina, Strain CCMP281" /NCGR_SAMPLE_ID=MMETSP1096 /ASSEMBLY_ACC=CAM_ASM_000453 /LENGTH=117 /DNA_ID=CAMNT_0023304063 /DNA_START=343 /DNA_END=696 /DNA_ORIENTATION=-
MCVWARALGACPYHMPGRAQLELGGIRGQSRHYFFCERLPRLSFPSGLFGETLTAFLEDDCQHLLGPSKVEDVTSSHEERRQLVRRQQKSSAENVVVVADKVEQPDPVVHDDAQKDE